MTGVIWAFIVLVAILAVWDVASDWVNRRDK